MPDVFIKGILAFSDRLFDDPVVEKAINGVEGLAFELFKRRSMSYSERDGCFLKSGAWSLEARAWRSMADDS